MFRVTIRELLLLTLIVGLVSAWWVEHKTRLEAAENTRKAEEHTREVTGDAERLAHFSRRDEMCGQEASMLIELQKKYGASRTFDEEGVELQVE